MERLLGAARDLSEKVESNESAAGELLRQCETLQEELKAMRQYRDCLQPLDGGESRGPLPRIEFSYIRQLQQDNSELRTLLEEHQAALEMIMTKYRQQVSNFMAMGRTDAMGEDHIAEALQSRTDQLYNMAAVMYRAAQAEDSTSCVTTEQVARLEYENRHLRELLQFSTPVLESNERTQPVSTLHASPSNKGAPQDSAVLKSVGRNELHRPLPGKQSGEESPVNSVVNCVDDDSQCVTPKAEGMDPVDLLDLARERLTDSVR